MLALLRQHSRFVKLERIPLYIGKHYYLRRCHILRSQGEERETVPRKRLLAALKPDVVLGTQDRDRNRHISNVIECVWESPKITLLSPAWISSGTNTNKAAISFCGIVALPKRDYGRTKDMFKIIGFELE